eukprot:11750766-Karenia_brevis.AAC.1
MSIYSGVWRKIWTLIDDLGPDRLTRVWVKGHATSTHVAQGLLTRWQQDANKFADQAAKAGSSMHPAVSSALEKHR